MGEMVERHGRINVLKGPGRYRLETDALGLYLPLPVTDQIAIKSIGQFESVTPAWLDGLARQAPTYSIITTPLTETRYLAFDSGQFRPVTYPQLWRLASFPQPDGQTKVDVYQWLLPPDFGVRWFQQGGDASPRLAWQLQPDWPLTAPPDTRQPWPSESTPQTASALLAEAGLEYVLATPELVAAQPALFEPFLATDGQRLQLRALPPGWRLAYVYPDLNCAWCLFQLRPPAESIRASFGQTIVLTGFDLSSRRLQPGDGGLHLTLYWEAAQAGQGDYVAFVHLIDAGGQLVAQSDQRPLQGQWPTARWPAGLRLADRHSLRLPLTLPAGQYTLRVGWYDPATGARLPVRTEASVVDRAVMVGPVVVEE
jgi:hypothetical protein